MIDFFWKPTPLKKLEEVYTLAAKYKGIALPDLQEQAASNWKKVFGL